MTQVHDFRQQLAYSEQISCEPFWNAVYRKAFPNMVNHMLCSGDTQGQRMGVDRIVYLGNNLTIAIDEKKRTKDYGDMLLEYISVDKTGAPGWACKDLAIDYLAYAVMPAKTCHLFPWQMLRRVWDAYGKNWIDTAEENERKLKEQRDGKISGYVDNGFKRIEAKNKDYSTWSVAVPMERFKAKIAVASIIDVSNNADLAGWNVH